MPIAPVILRQWILGGIGVMGLQFSEMLAALPVDEADLPNRPAATGKRQVKKIAKSYLTKTYI
jgi:hypothetical protein